MVNSQFSVSTTISSSCLVGGAGNDTLTGAGGRDIFDYGFKNAGNDTITDFTLGNTTTNTNADILNLSDLLIGYSNGFTKIKCDRVGSSIFATTACNH
jgi:Ca2+-binding RTX toxin-like protein